MNQIIYDESIVRKFIDEVLPKAGDLEQYFVSLSCRKKYLTPEDRLLFTSTNAEMFHQQIASTKSGLFSAILKCQTPKEAFQTKSGFIYPMYAMVCYINLFTSSTILALEEFNSIMNRNMMQLVNNSLEGKDCASAKKAINRAYKTYVDCVQRAKGTSLYVDIDFDISKDYKYIMDKFVQAISAQGVSGFVIETRGGFHVLMKRDTIHYNYNTDIANAVNAYTNDAIVRDNVLKNWEIVNNTKHSMVACPGTLQAGFPVSYYSF